MSPSNNAKQLVDVAVKWRLENITAPAFHRGLLVEALDELTNFAWRTAQTIGHENPAEDHGASLMLIHHRNWWVQEFLEEQCESNWLLRVQISMSLQMHRVALQAVDRVSGEARERLEEGVVRKAAVLMQGIQRDHRAHDKWWLDCVRNVS